jgi:PAS domain S-box-containing protein
MSKKALVVDNDFFFVEFLKGLLEKRGFEVIGAYDGKEAISKLEEGPIDFLFLDIIMPKIDGKQVIEYTRVKFPERHFPIIAMSGSFIEQLDRIKNLGADYYIAKGPMEKMKSEINGFLDRIENDTLGPAPDSNVLEPEGLYPREATEELINLLNYKLAVIESIGIGIIVVDKDTKILSANTMALDMTKKSLNELLNHPITDIFPRDEKARIVGSLKKVILQKELKKSVVSVTTQSGEIEINVSALRIDGEIAGWIIALV